VLSYDKKTGKMKDAFVTKVFGANIQGMTISARKQSKHKLAN
jgi:hypothetical protein